jgi:hypothetical protein
MRACRSADQFFDFEYFWHIASFLNFFLCEEQKQ